MGLFERHEAREAYDQVYGGGRPHHEVSRELLAGAAGFAAAEIDKDFQDDRYGHLSRHEAKRLAREQADYLWQQHGRY